MSVTATVKKKNTKVAAVAAGVRQVAAGEFKAKCLRIMDEVNKTGRPLIVTKRGMPVVKIVPVREEKVRSAKDSIFGRMKGIVEIVGDPDDLIKPAFPLEDYDMLK